MKFSHCETAILTILRKISLTEKILNFHTVLTYILAVISVILQKAIIVRTMQEYAMSFFAHLGIVELRRYVSFLSGIMFEMTLFPLATFVKGLTVTKVSKMVAKHK